MSALQRQRNGRVRASVLARIKAAHIEQALDALDQGVEHGFGPSTDYDLLARDHAYPPKAVLGVAASFALGQQLGPDDLSGGEGSPCFVILRKHGYRVVPKADAPGAVGTPSSPRRRCVVWNNIRLRHVEGALAVCHKYGRVAFQRGGKALRSLCRSTEVQSGTMEAFIVEGRSDRVVARGRIRQLLRREEMTPGELHAADEVRLPTDDAVTEEFVLIASDIVLCTPPLDLRTFRKCSDDTPLRPGGRWTASLAYVPEGVLPRLTPSIEDETDEELKGFPEGEARMRMVSHRRREGRAREAKIRDAIKRTGAVHCEVKGCGFDFLVAYGEVGREYGQVHHLKPLAANVGPVVTDLTELAILCANCHAMVHRGGANRSLEEVAAMLTRARASSRT